MEIKNIRVMNDGYINCKSSFYSSCDGLNNDMRYNFSVGVNKLIGDIDSGVWAISYLLSMYNSNEKDFVLFEPSEVIVNNNIISLNEFMQYSCYMDITYPLFSSKNTVKDLVEQGIMQTGINENATDVCDMFHIDKERFERPLSGVGNEIFRAMGAIGYCYGKQVFCFPWLSRMRFDGYHRHMTDLLDILTEFNKIVILPVGKA